MANHKKQFCPVGHDTTIVGRLNGQCCACRKEYQRIYNKTSGQKAAVARWYVANKDHKKDRSYRRIYGISLADYVVLYNVQKGICKICTDWFSSLVIDHDHSTGKIRGLLCSQCNRAMGLFKDDPLRLRAAAEYLEARAIA